MAVTDKKIMEKMEIELQLARSSVQPAKAKEHIGRLQLLCELMLEADGLTPQLTDQVEQSTAGSLPDHQEIAAPKHIGDSLLDF